MNVTFNAGVPPLHTPIFVSGYGYATVSRFHEETVDIYVGHGRTFRIPSSTAWRPV